MTGVAVVRDTLRVLLSVHYRENLRVMHPRVTITLKKPKEAVNPIDCHPGLSVSVSEALTRGTCAWGWTGMCIRTRTKTLRHPTTKTGEALVLLPPQAPFDMAVTTVLQFIQLRKDWMNRRHPDKSIALSRQESVDT